MLTMSLQLQRKTKYASCLMFLSMTQTIFIWELEHNLKPDLHPLACRVFSWRILDIGEQCSWWFCPCAGGYWEYEKENWAKQGSK